MLLDRGKLIRVNNMTHEQIALTQLNLAEWQLWVTGLAIFLGPLTGVLFTLWFQSRKDKNNQKQHLFLILMAHRKSYPPTFELVNGLNLIDVVFAEHRRVVELWHEYYDLLCHNPVNWQLTEPKYLDLLAEMAKILGYDKLAQTDISKFYSPRAHGDQTQLLQDTQNELLRVLKNTERFVVVPRNE